MEKSLHLQFAFETAVVHEFAFMNESDEGTYQSW